MTSGKYLKANYKCIYLHYHSKVLEKVILEKSLVFSEKMLN